MLYTIRPATEFDFETILVLIHEFASFQKVPDRVNVTLSQMTAGKDFFRCLVAEDNQKKIIGYTTFFIAYYTWSGKAIYLDDLFVTELGRGQKIGTQLMQSIFDIARKENCTKVRWQVSHWNKPAIGFYQKLGAKVDDVEWNCDLIL